MGKQLGMTTAKKLGFQGLLAVFVCFLGLIPVGALKDGSTPATTQTNPSSKAGDFEAQTQPPRQENKLNNSESGMKEFQIILEFSDSNTPMFTCLYSGMLPV